MIVNRTTLNNLDFFVFGKLKKMVPSWTGQPRSFASSGSTHTRTMRCMVPPRFNSRCRLTRKFSQSLSPISVPFVEGMTVKCGGVAGGSSDRYWLAELCQRVARPVTLISAAAIQLSVATVLKVLKTLFKEIKCFNNTKFENNINKAYLQIMMSAELSFNNLLCMLP